MDYEKVMKALRNADAAGDEAAARRLAGIAKRLRDGGSNSPVTPSEGDEGFSLMGMLRGGTNYDPDSMAGRAQAAAESVDDPAAMRAARQLFSRAANSASLGVGGASERYVGGLVDLLGDKLFGDGEQTYVGAVDNIRDQQRQRREENPGATLAGDVAGSILPGAAAGKVIGGLGNAAARIAAGGGFSAADNMLTQLGAGEIENGGDLAAQGTIGAFLGAGGQAAGELIEPISRMVRGAFGDENALRQGAMRQLGRSLSDTSPGAGRIGNTLATPDGQDIREYLGTLADQTGGPAGRHFGETDEALTRGYQELLGSGATAGMHKPTAAMSSQRVQEATDTIADTLDNLIDSNRSVTGAAATRADKDQLAAAKKVYSSIFDTDVGRNTRVLGKGDLLERLTSAKHADGTAVFDMDNANSLSRNLQKKVMDEVALFGGPQGTDVTMKGLQNLQFTLDNLLSTAKRGSATGGDAMNVRDITAMRRTVRQIMADVNPDFAKASAEFADVEAGKAAYDAGKTFMRGTSTSQPLGNVMDELENMSQPELWRAQDGAKDWLMDKLDESPNYLKQLAGSKPALAQRIKAIFGGALDSNATTADDLIETIAKAAEQRNMHTSWLTTMDNAKRFGVHDQAGRGASDLVDTAAMVAEPGGASKWTRLRRILQNTHPDKRQQVTLELMQAADPETARRLLEEAFSAADRPNASGWGGALGIGAASGLGTMATGQ